MLATANYKLFVYLPSIPLNNMIRNTSFDTYMLLNFIYCIYNK